MEHYKLALCYDSKEEHLAAGLSSEEVAEFDSEETIQHIHEALSQLGHRIERVRGGIRLASLLTSGRRWDLVFNLAEGLRGRSREAQVPALCDLFEQPFVFSDAVTCGTTLDKALAKRVVRDAGLPTPRFALVESVADQSAQLIAIDLEYPLFVKPVAEGNSKGVTPCSLVEDGESLWILCRELLAAYRQPLLIEEYLPGCEMTVGIVGNGSEATVLGVMEIGFKQAAEAVGYTTVNKREQKARLTFHLAQDPDVAAKASTLALAAFSLFSCRDAARIDMRCDKAGRPCFLEVNALPGLHPDLSDLPKIAALVGIPYLDLVRRILDAAVSRGRHAVGLRKLGR
jgi:D-alanine-D-alanine ligase